ncbi:hypothetical protein GOB94_14020 [Granulicella sp. 5B5]|uniref:hypothetical protein n=1 Tax=Granulicella sp. 5B5 TaxID=1617967 RepID=UPI0015F426C6|nr:hypothetical protein [Granulicella sp. 5B5]QMV19682.1 hypothetical protein GOB94_14020 [Granulicella sp. 5B5]
MGRHRKSTAELERKGAFNHDPARGQARSLEPVVTGPLGPPPPDFVPEGTELGYRNKAKLLQAWRDLEAATKEVLVTSADRLHFETTARLLAQSREPGAPTSVFSQLNRYLSQLGLNPASRSLVNGVGVKTTEQEEDEWKQAADGSTGLPVQ